MRIDKVFPAQRRGDDLKMLLRNLVAPPHS